MNLYINEKIFSLHNKFYVKNENDEDVYEIASKIISIGSKTTISDLGGNKLVYIEQEILHLMPQYNVYINDAYVCKIIKKFNLLKNNYELDNGYRVEGNFMALNFDIFDEAGTLIGTVAKKFISFGDKYQITINDESKLLIILAIVVVIANDINKAQSTNSGN